ncbi:hypothetical protein JRO89_XS10G0155400 [Xanthoceras sorbifolium]|uniref:Uncharacterized protein n=1 Tax=Xanthoceras sorbifolium TaxID=99658 RepID=A0ABQ8HIT8_9ROSI|nr:hypothetical protein JRO89_XS10G0155400 [Xanthoceras sorbifolium]
MQSMMADHDRRREAMKKQRSEARETVMVLLHSNLQMGIQTNFERDLLQGVDDHDLDGEDLACLLQDLSNICLSNCTAKAA